MAKKKLSQLTEELALALDVASRLNIDESMKPNIGPAKAWGNPSPFQEKINELLVKAGRKPILPRVRPLEVPDGKPVSEG